MLTTEQAWQVLAQVPDPEIPVVSVTELGIVREVVVGVEGVAVVVTPTYCGCPATEQIAESIRSALQEAGAAQVQVTQRLAPPWTTDWIAPAARDKLRGYGIAPPEAAGGARPIHLLPRPACPRCAGRDTERLSQFGATACKALYRCRGCGEPFEYFKPL